MDIIEHNNEELVNRLKKSLFPLSKNKIVNGNFFEGINPIDVKSIKITDTYRFGTFDRPINLDISKNTLNIFLDHHIDFNENDYNIMVIDHHLMEILYDRIYSSNSLMMYDFYDEIIHTIYTIIQKMSIYDLNINVYGHYDLDGIGSLLIFKHMINQIKENNIDNININDIQMAKIIGEYGDIADNPEKHLTGMIEEKFIPIYNKKFKSFTTAFSKFLKTFRSCLKYIDEEDYDNVLIKDFENLTNKKYTIIYNFLNSKIFDPIKNMTNVNNKTIIAFINTIAESKFMTEMLMAYNEESERVVNNFISPTVGATELNVIFKSYPNNKYKLLIINSAFDLGTSVCWKYRTSVQKATRGNCNKNEWYFNITDYFTPVDIININKNKSDYSIFNSNNIAVYNTELNKMTLFGNNAYDISVSFGGGGHKSIDDKGGSLGSVVVDFNEVATDIIIENIR